MYHVRVLFGLLLIIFLLGFGCASEIQPEPLIAFESERDGNREIYVMNPDGSDQTRLTNNTSYDGFPAWRPGVVLQEQEDEAR